MLEKPGRYGAAWALRFLGEEGHRSLRDALEHGDQPARRAVCEALGDFEEVVPGTVPRSSVLNLAAAELIQALEDPAPRVREAAVRAVGQLPIRQALPQMIRALKDADPKVRRAAIRARATRAFSRTRSAPSRRSFSNARIAVCAIGPRLPSAWAADPRTAQVLGTTGAEGLKALFGTS